MLKFLVLIATIGLISKLSSADLPPEITKCKAAETDCIRERILEILKKYPKGNPSFGLSPVDKLPLQNIVLSQTQSGRPIQLEFKFNTGELYGIEKAMISKVVGFADDLEKSKFEVYGTLPTILIKGDYAAQGRVILLPLNGNGDAEIKLKNVKFGIKAKLGKQIINGKRYAVLKTLKVLLEPELMQVRLNNLFNGNKELGETMNQTINENWRDIWNELGNGINKTVEKIMTDLLSAVLKELSYDDFYKKD